PRLRSLLRLAEKYARDVFHAYEDPGRDELVHFLDNAEKPGGLNHLTVALERAAAIVYSLRSGAAGTARPSSDPLTDCDPWSKKKGVPRSYRGEKDEPPCPADE